MSLAADQQLPFQLLVSAGESGINVPSCSRSSSSRSEHESAPYTNVVTFSSSDEQILHCNDRFIIIIIIILSSCMLYILRRVSSGNTHPDLSVTEHDSQAGDFH
jgi:hypothetical protein